MIVSLRAAIAPLRMTGIIVPLPMARAATGDVSRAADVVLFYQSQAQLVLIRVALPIDGDRFCCRGLFIAHVEYLIPRAEIFFWGAMAVEAPLHLQRFLLIHQRHLVDGAVAGVATDSFSYMNAVIEKNEVGELVDAGPLQALAGAIAGADWLKKLGVGPDLRVAVHAGASGRDSGEARSLDRGVAVAAVDAKSGNVVLVAERDRLWLAHAGVGDVWRALNFHRDPTQRGNDEHRAKNGGAGQSVSAAMKNLRHAYLRA